MHKRYFILLLALLSIHTLIGQNKPEKMDMITLTNGYQLLGHIIEQRPGIDMKIYRPVENDTLTLVLDSVEKIAVVQVNRYAEKSVNEKDTTLNIGRFNNKKNVYGLAFVASSVALPNNLLKSALLDTSLFSPYIMNPKGIGLSYYRSVHNTFFWGASMAFQGQRRYIYPLTTSKSFYSDSYADFKFMLEGKVRLSGRAQTKRFTTLFGLGVGIHRIVAERFWHQANRIIVVIDPGHIYDKGYDFEQSQKMEMFGNNLTVQTSLTFKINPDNNSGFTIEPMLAYCRPKLTITHSDYNGTPGLDVKIVQRIDLFIPSIRIGYFF
ncbi:MAG: hypothetical protein ACRCYO_09900 [Bacteroidia bacterium]